MDTPFPYFVALGSLCAVLGCSTGTSHRSVQPAATAAHPAADAETRAIAEREMLRRQQAAREAAEMIEEGDRRRSEGDLGEAVRLYQESVDTLP